MEAWEQYFRATGNCSANAKKVLSWFRNGIILPFVGVQHKSHDRAPDWRKKLEIVRRMLTKAMGPDQEQYLQTDGLHVNLR